MFPWYTICHFVSTILLKNFTRIRPWTRADLSVPWWLTEDFLQHARSSQASMICPVCRGEILIPEVECGWTTMQGGLSCWTRWEYDPGQFLEDRNGNPQELYWQQFFLLASFVLTSRRSWERQMSNLEQGKIRWIHYWYIPFFLLILHIRNVMSSEKTLFIFCLWGGILLPSLSKKYYDMPLQGSEPITIMENHSQILKIPHLLGCKSPPMLFTAFSPRWKAHRYHSIPSLLESMEFPVLFLGERGERRRI